MHNDTLKFAHAHTRKFYTHETRGTPHTYSYETLASTNCPRTYSMRREHTHLTLHAHTHMRRKHTHTTLKMWKSQSKVWLYFSRHDANSARCSICGKIIAAKTGTTTNMMKPLTVHGVNIIAESCSVFDW